MKLFGATLSPFVRKTAAFLNEKKLNWTHVPLGLGAEDPEFLECSPFKKIPGFSDGDLKLSDSTAICVYVDAAYPETRLIPEDPALRGKTIWWDEIADTILTLGAGKLFFNRVVAPRFLKQEGDEAMAKQGEGELVTFFDYFEQHVPEPGAFLVGGELTLADLAMASPFANLEHVEFMPNADNYPRICTWVEAMHARDSFAGMIAAERKIMRGEFGGG